MASRFPGKVVIVTGSSNGIGRSTAQLFVEEGAKVTITGRSEKALQETFDLLVASGAKPSDILTVQGNLTDEAVQKKIVEETVAKFGKLDILINNAGGLCQDTTEQMGFEQSMETYDYVMDLNLRTVITLTKQALPHLIKSKGEIVMVSSICAKAFSNPTYPFYSISKAALDQLTRSLAATYIKQGVRVNSVNPGWISTTIMQKQGITVDQQEELESTLASSGRLIPIGRTGKPREIAELIAFLADRSKSEYIIGQCLAIDGGASLFTPIFQSLTELEKPAL